MPTVLLARNQNISVGGVALTGTRDFDVDFDVDSVDVTRWDSEVRAELPLSAGVTVTLEVYTLEDLQRFTGSIGSMPPDPVTVAISGAGSGRFLVHAIKAKGPFSGALSFQVVLKRWPY